MAPGLTTVAKSLSQLNPADVMTKYFSGRKIISDMEKPALFLSCSSEDDLLGGPARLAQEPRRSVGMTDIA